MTIRRLYVDEVTTITSTFAETVTCINPEHTPIGPGNECHVNLYNVGIDLGSVPPTLSFSYDAQFEYQYAQNSSTFYDYCTVIGNSGSATLPSGVTLCCGTLPTLLSSISCDPSAITTTPTSVSGNVSLAFTVTNLCCPTIICVDDTVCP